MPADPSAVEKAAATIRLLWAATFAFPLQFAAILMLPRILKVGNPLRIRGGKMAFVAGYFTWLIITPAAFCVFVLASITHMRLTGQGPEKHPLTELGNLAGPANGASSSCRRSSSPRCWKSGSFAASSCLGWHRNDRSHQLRRTPFSQIAGPFWYCAVLSRSASSLRSARLGSGSPMKSGARFPPIC